MRALIGLLLIASLISGCTNQGNSKLVSAISAAEAYKRTQLEADFFEYSDEAMLEQIRSREDQLRPLTTDSFFQKKSADRMFVYALDIAQIKKKDLRLSDLAFEERETDDSSVIKLNYEGLLEIGDENMAVSGRIELIEDGEKWKVKYDSYNLKDFMKIIDDSILERAAR
ncbi:hypothetical protein D3P09_07605 [Paenibacillus pinisoli]|uniref:DUF4878 domain-containing protein n=1 Tax=Paenibacillus pinisoli TaxID=1276110 RepID=A0A3A6PHV6_9BACL|nr:hypothetical protein [Paenibacillus pinisoli]RJX39306.1 hypothetical protein D3P09_07605 [Paenibacillus pinisoli]